jgi:hypothetical protein
MLRCGRKAAKSIPSVCYISIPPRKASPVLIYGVFCETMTSTHTKRAGNMAKLQNHTPDLTTPEWLEARRALESDTPERFPSLTRQEVDQLSDQLRREGYEVRFCSDKNMHMTVRGKARRVDYYPTTGTVTAAPIRGKARGTRARGLSFEEGLALVRKLADNLSAHAN